MRQVVKKSCTRKRTSKIVLFFFIWCSSGAHYYFFSNFHTRQTRILVKFSPLLYVQGYHGVSNFHRCQTSMSYELHLRPSPVKFSGAANYELRQLRLCPYRSCGPQAATFYMHILLRPKFDFFSKICYNKRLGVWPAAVYKKRTSLSNERGVHFHLIED